MKSEAAVDGQLWTVQVVFANGQPRCKESVRAVSGLDALEKIRKRYPFADMARTTVAQEGETVVKPLLTLPAQQEALQEPEDDALEQVPFAVEVEEDLEPEPIAQAADPEPEREPRPGLIVGPMDSQGRRTILEDTARAAAMLHARGEATWDQMAAELGVNTDHLRKRCRRHYPATDQKDGQPVQKSAQVNRRMILHWVPVSTLRPVDAWYPVLASKPGEQWEVRPYGNRVELEKEGFLWAIRLGNLPRPES